MAEDGSFTYAPLSAASDIDGDTLEAFIVAGPAHGTLSVNADGSFSYKPSANYFGTDSYTYRVNDGQLDSNIATVSLTITAVNDAPVLVNQSATLAEDSSITLTPLATAFDVDGDALTAFVVAGPAHGKLTVNADGTFRYQADADYFGADSFTYRVNDGQLDSNIATVSLTVTAVNDAPVTQDGTAALDEDGSIVLDLRSLGYDIDSGVLTVDIVGAPAHGSLVANADGTFTYSPAANYNGADAIRFRLNDGELLSNVATLALTVRAVNDAPVAGASLVTGTEDTPVFLRWSAFAVSDIDGDALTVKLTSLPMSSRTFPREVPMIFFPCI